MGVSEARQGKIEPLGRVTPAERPKRETLRFSALTPTASQPAPRSAPAPKAIVKPVPATAARLGGLYALGAREPV